MVDEKQKIVYLTGCFGFMATYVAKACLERGWRVYGVDKITPVSQVNKKLCLELQMHPHFHFEQIDIKDMKHLYDCDYVINFAAESHVGNSIVDSSDFINTNILGVKNLLELVRNKQDNTNSRPIFFHISTDEVYGDIEDGAHTESDILKPSNPYSASKASSDMLITAWARTYGLEYIILRPTNNYGIGQYPEKLIPLSVKNMMRGKKIRLHNAGTPIRNWLHASDTAEAVMTIIDSGKVNEIYNVAGGFEQKNIDTVKKVIQQYNGNLENWDRHVDLAYSRIGQDVRYALDDSKLRKLGWEPKKPFHKEIKQIVAWYKQNFIW